MKRCRALLPLLFVLSACSGGGGEATSTPPSPTVGSVTPASGPMSGGTSVVVAGTGFVAGATLTFDGVEASSVTVPNATEIHATTPAHATGWSAVAVRNPDGKQDELADAFFFNQPILVVAPSSGPAAGGSVVSVVAFGGYAFSQPVEILFGGVAGVVRSSPSPTSTAFAADVPAGSPGEVQVVVRNADATEYPATATYTYQ